MFQENSYMRCAGYVLTFSIKLWYILLPQCFKDILFLDQMPFLIMFPIIVNFQFYLKTRIFLCRFAQFQVHSLISYYNINSLP
jgi:hypothetical protein